MSDVAPYDQHLREAAADIVRCAVITVSDTRSKADDRSGKRILDLLAEAGHEVSHYQIVRDEPADLEPLLNGLLARHDVDVILTTGGTGVSSRDRTVPVVEALLDLTLPGFGELFRILSHSQIGSGAMLSRAVGGVSREKLIFAMPGSTAAVELAMKQLILPEIKHLLHQLRK